MPRKELQAGPIHKWDREADDKPRKPAASTTKPFTVKGIFRGLRSIPSDFGDGTGTVVDIERAGAIETWSGPAMLIGKLRFLAPGAAVEVCYCGMTEGRKGQSHSFMVFELTGPEAEAAKAAK